MVKAEMTQSISPRSIAAMSSESSHGTISTRRPILRAISSMRSMSKPFGSPVSESRNSKGS